MTLTVCGLLGSPFFRKICTQLNEKDISFEIENLSPFKAGESFTAINPVRRIPLLKDSDEGKDFVLADSSAIFHYIERKHPTPSMMPESNAEYGKALWFEEYADTEMATKIGMGVFRSMVFPQMAGNEPETDKAMYYIREKLPEVHDYLEGQITGKQWFAGDRFGLADISIAVQYGNLAFTGYAPSEERWPNLRAFMTRMGEKDSFSSMHIKATRFFADMKKIEIDPSEGL
jgi:glutathione S-transferase